MSDAMLLGVLRMPVNENDPLFMGQFVSRAREAANRIESDAREITTLRQQLEQAAARVAELEEGMKAIYRIADHTPKDHLILEIAQRSVSGKETEAWLLRKQADAIDEWANDQHLPPDDDLTELGWHAKRIYERAKDYAQRLRQAADEAELNK